jgi:hypothetical protein
MYDNISLISSWNEKYFRKVVDKIKTPMCSATFLKDCAIYEIKLKNMVELDRPQMTV